MNIIKDEFKNEEKKLKKHYAEKANLDKIINHMKMCNSSQELHESEISRMYGFEQLKHEFSGYYSFNLCKIGGVIRLLFILNNKNNSVELKFISMNHYEDFRRKLNK